MNKIEKDNMIAFHPGYYISEILENLDITQSELAKRLNTTDKTLSKLVNGQISISDEIAIKLSFATGTSVGLWFNLQAEYDRRKLEMDEVEKQLEAESEYLDVLDYKFFVNCSNAADIKGKIERTRELLRILNIASFSVLERKDLLACFKTATSNERNKKIICSNAWVQVAINKANEKKTDDFNEKKLTLHLEEIRSMTVKTPTEFMPRLNEIFMSSGIAFVLLEHLKNSGVNAATKWINENKVMIAINDRGRDADKFWFALFHEINHVFQKQVKRIMIDGDVVSEYDNTLLECESDTFAQKILIPYNKYAEFVNAEFYTYESIITFAKEINIAPGIVVGRLQHDNRIPFNKFHDLKLKYKILMN